MANGILSNGGTNPAALTNTTLTTIYQVPADTFVVASINVCNRHATDSAAIRIAISAGTTPTTAEYIEYDAELVSNGVLERTGLVIEAGKYIVVYSTGGSVSVMAYGIETATA